MSLMIMIIITTIQILVIFYKKDNSNRLIYFEAQYLGGNMNSLISILCQNQRLKIFLKKGIGQNKKIKDARSTLTLNFKTEYKLYTIMVVA